MRIRVMFSNDRDGDDHREVILETTVESGITAAEWFARGFWAFEQETPVGGEGPLIPRVGDHVRHVTTGMHGTVAEIKGDPEYAVPQVVISPADRPDVVQLSAAIDQFEVLHR